MSDVTRNVRDIDSTDRRALENMLGQPLHENDQVVIRVLSPDVKRGQSDGVSGRVGTTDRSLPDRSLPDRSLPEWCNVYEGLSDDDIADLEQSVLRRANLTRAAE